MVAPGSSPIRSATSEDTKGFGKMVCETLCTVIRTIYFYVFIVLWTGLVAFVFPVPPAIVQFLLRLKGAQFANTVLYHGVRFCSLPWRLAANVMMDDRCRVEEGSAVVIFNHHSYLDIFMLLHLFPRIRMTARRSLFWIPFLGWGMAAMGQIPHRRSNPEDAMEKAVWWLERNTFVGIFPEGTRAPDAEIGPLQRGAFRLAQQTTELVQPVVVVGTGRVWSKHQFWIRSLGPVWMRILPPVSVPRSAGRKRLQEINAEVREMMLAEHQTMERELFPEEASTDS